MRGVLLNEWRRIGIVLSVAWGIGVSIFTWQSAEVLINDTQFLITTASSGSAKKATVGSSCAFSKRPLGTSHASTLWGLLPIPVIWLLLWIFVVSARWFTRRFHIMFAR